MKPVIPISLLLLSVIAHATDITLTDGRIFIEAKVVSQTDNAVCIRYAGGFAQVSKTLLPADIAAQFPVLSGPSAQKKYEEMTPDEQAAFVADWKVKRQAEQDAEMAKVKAWAADAEERNRRQAAARAAEQNGSAVRTVYHQTATGEERMREGVKLISVALKGDRAIVAMQNTTDQGISFDWRALEGNFASTGASTPATVAQVDNVSSGCDIEPGQTRHFLVTWSIPFSVAENSLTAVRWGTDWISN